MTAADASLRQRQASDPRASAWVNANAGSGKTHVLVDRVIRLMLAGTPPSRILCLTFTKAAAAEMSLRIFERLSGWIWLDDEALTGRLRQIGIAAPDQPLLAHARQLFAIAQETPGGLKIQTIHAFCERLLQLFPVEAGVVPNFTVMDDRGAADLLAAARDAALNEAIAAPESPAGLALSRIARRAQADRLDELLREMLAAALSLQDLIGTPEGRAISLATIRNRLGLAPGLTVEGLLAGLVPDGARYESAAQALAAGSSNDQKLGTSIARSLQASPSRLTGFRDVFLTTTNDVRKLDKVPTKATDAAHPWIREFLQAEQQRFVTGAGQLADLERVEATAALMELSASVLGLYEARKRTLGHYDFADLISRSRRLLRERPDAAWVLYRLDGGIDHVLLDEAQDTSPEQWEIVRALTAEFFAGSGGRGGLKRTMFAVGDRKQSIYSFQGADPAVFGAMREDFRDRVTAAGQDFADVNFIVSFRSVPEVLQAVDKVFGADSLARRGLNGADEEDVVHESNRRTERGLVELWPLVEPDEAEESEPWTAPVDREPANAPSRKLARRIAATIKSWIGQRDLGNLARPVEPGDILILVRKRNTFFDAVISELRKHEVPVAGADRLSLGESIAVLDLVALASFAVLPEDDYSLACLLKSPLLPEPLTEDGLLALAHGRGAASLWKALADASDAACRTAHALLGNWLIAARSLRPFEFFASVLQHSRARFIARLGSEADDALGAFLQAALDYERDHAPSLAGFITWFQSGDIEIKRNMEQGAGEVRIMTVHGAKGLEAPIVILPDTVSLPDQRNQSQLLGVPIGNSNASLPFWCFPTEVDSPEVEGLKQAGLAAQAEEYRRLLYVAMTRARDELYICGYRNQQEPKPECWYRLAEQALTPLMRPLAEGIRRLGADPLPVPAVMPTAQTADSRLPAWTSSAAASAAPDAMVLPVTAVARGSEPAGIGGGPAAGRGLAIHRLLQVLPETAPDDREALARRITARAGQPPEIADQVLGLLANPALSWLFGDDGMAEVTLSGRLASLRIAVSGRIDRLVVAEDSITIADYKTDRQWPGSVAEVAPAYLRQMALYARLMADAYPGRKIRAVLVWTGGPAVMELPDAALDEALRDLQSARP